MKGRKVQISPDLLKKIKDSVNLVDVVSEHVVLKKSGSNHGGLCPFHSERSPSFSVSETKQVYHCFGCKAGGDLISFVQEIHGLSFPEAVEELADRAGISIAPTDISQEESSEEAKRYAAQRKQLAIGWKLNRFAAAFYRKQLMNHDVAQTYLESRRVTDVMGRDFYLGAAPNAWDELARHLLQAKAPLSMADRLGLVRPSTKGRKGPGEPGYFDLFRNRLMFPILDMRGKVVAFGGRSLEGEAPKYLNSPESFVFQKSKITYGLYQAQKYIREADEVILVEGYFDVLALQAAGFRNTVATCGTALTREHLKAFKRLGSKVTLLFDGDTAGKAAMERAMEVGLQEGWVLRGAFLPDGLDPDELLARPDGKSQLEELLAGATGVLDRRIREAVAHGRKGPEERTVALKRVARWLQQLSDPVARRVRIEDFQKKMNLSRDLLREALGQASAEGGAPRSQPSVDSSASERGPRKKIQPLSPSDRLLLRAFLNWKENGVYFTAEPGLPPGMTFSDLLEGESAKSFTWGLMMTPGGFRQLESEPEVFLQGCEDAQVRSIITEALMEAPSVPKEDLTNAIRASKARLWARFSQQLKASLVQAELNDDTDLQAKLLQDYLDVQRKMKELIKFYDQAKEV